MKNNHFMMHVPGLFITQSEGKGRGVFTIHPLKKGDLIEICPVIIIPPEDRQHIDKSVLYDYYFVSPKPNSQMCIALGYGSIYNHSYQPNAEIVFDLHNQRVEFHCIRLIDSGEEIFTDYSGGMKDAPELWFELA